MLRFRINPDEKQLTPDNKKMYSITPLIELKNHLITAKNKIDEVWKHNQSVRYWKEFDPFKNEKAVIARLGDTYNVTNAWIKCYEMLVEFDIIPEKPKHKTFVHFDNAAFPGSFIASTHHHIKTKRNWSDKEFQWYGSSLISENELDSEPLEDKYKLYERHPDNWVMSKENNGDVLNVNAQQEFHKRLGNTVDLYTSDIGFDVSSDYNNQELLQLPVNIGQIISGLITLRKGGCFITKQYTNFESSTISIMYALSHMFDEFYLCKPYSSREANSETYLVGIGFKQAVDMKHPYVKALLDRISGDVNPELPLFYHKDYPKTYLKHILNASTQIFERQIKKIEHDVNHSLEGAKSNTNKITKHPAVKQFRRAVEPILENWHLHMNISPILKKDKLDMSDAYHQG